MKVNIGLWNMRPWVTGDLAAVLDMTQLADRKGISAISIPDHILMSLNVDKYPYGKLPVGTDPLSNSEAFFYEPLTLLAAMASVTERIGLTTNIVVMPVRPAVFFAKQAATLDVLSKGRLFLGVGVGWQKEEFDSTNTPWEGRFGYLDEQIRICKALWSERLVSFQGKYMTLNNVCARPYPLQGAHIPILFGVGPTPRQFRRIAELGDGWLPDPTIHTPEALAPHIMALREAFSEAGRDPAMLQVGVRLNPIRKKPGDKLADLEASLAQIPALRQAGATSVYIYPFHYCADEREYEPWLDRMARVVNEAD
jgi:probable F420-dependent oxidoreductase